MARAAHLSPAFLLLSELLLVQYNIIKYINDGLLSTDCYEGKQQHKIHLTTKVVVVYSRTMFRSDLPTPLTIFYNFFFDLCLCLCFLCLLCLFLLLEILVGDSDFSTQSSSANEFSILILTELEFKLHCSGKSGPYNLFFDLYCRVHFHFYYFYLVYQINYQNQDWQIFLWEEKD
ncbi:hypothetical protein AGLY_002242 [Aphis glycines]|uniref:Uncharacterized protein n=1 Tax=Aphis glycines TaxID=307491 RepID=A0A6G0U586_APHGL|nr:hypothetical protein AGLY_002242 [Aphis glycines]